MHILVPTSKAEDWKQFLAKESHWRTGHSAMALAQCWEASKRRGMPLEVQQLFGVQPTKDVLLPAGTVEGVELAFAWCAGCGRFLRRLTS